jgi:hypothetical protein
LVGHDENGKPFWSARADLEPRPLVQLESVAQVNHGNLNGLYEQGDNFTYSLVFLDRGEGVNLK